MVAVRAVAVSGKALDEAEEAGAAEVFVVVDMGVSFPRPADGPVGIRPERTVPRAAGLADRSNGQPNGQPNWPGR
ncbi:hypothetical protein GCM10010389_51240 [Streptomyces echinoruber]|uniref:Uncharacterized protein n=1 Tax=Streptomyces echinoruber TaxID=68898 RepID=A0A918RQ30_9ACTN|nr:hypothetical protein GCM10010389_51240 [Streptomyces echinoruber]